MAYYYIAGFVPEEAGYTVYFPDFPDVCIAGKTVPEAIDNAKDALYEFVRDLTEKGKNLPDPSEMVDVIKYVKGIRKMDNLPYPDGTLYQYVEMPYLDFKPVRINITVPKDALSIIDAKAKRAGLSRSSFMTSASLSFHKY